MDQTLLMQIPKVDVLLAEKSLVQMEKDYTYDQLKDAARSYLQNLREGVIRGDITSIGSVSEVASQVAARLTRRGAYSLRQVVNATGVVLHTNLGRAPLGKEIAQHVADVAMGYSNLEYNLDRGERGSRYNHIEKIICEITGAEAAMVVNNNAGAVFLMLNTLCKGQGVAVSRGEQVEIGGSFRIPEIMVQSGARLIEVGTTNKTHERDYARAISEEGAQALLKVHPSNFMMVGFTENVSVAQLSVLAHDSGALVLYDMGSAPLFPNEVQGLDNQETIRGVLKDGADVVCFSGDKLVGSAQGGILVGRRELIERIRANQLTRMLRIDKLSLAALEMTMQMSREPKLAQQEVPVVHMLSMSAEKLKVKAEAMEAAIDQAVPEVVHEVVAVQDETGGGSLPGIMLDGYAVSISVPGLDPNQLEEQLRHAQVPIVARVSREHVLLSARTIMDGDVELVCRALATVVQEAAGAPSGGGVQ
ncbi:MAG: L-seryl-tRNA(Sec) selenium transferase [Atopobiaceae bacterium]|jgi:L-seryl-tRNA(Ser) seleniumtransferase